VAGLAPLGGNLAGESGMIEQPTITTSRLTLRPFSLSDAPAIIPLAGDRRVAATTLLIPHPYSLADAEKWISGHRTALERGESIDFAVCLRNSTLIGAIGMGFKREHERAEIGYWIGVPWWGQGYATAAAAAVMDWAFATLGLHRIYAYHYASNPASGRVLAKLGMVREGVLRGHIVKWDEHMDCVQYGILRPEWEAAQSARAANNRP
jgi:RimJ/RimL family protein N-acetyltransferase